MTEKIRSVRLKIDPTINCLDQIAKMKIEEAIKNKTFNINSLVKNKRGISYDKEILYLARFYLLCIEKRGEPIIKSILKKSKKINKIC